MTDTLNETTTDYPTLGLTERDRRWEVVRQLMSTNGLDGLVVFGYGRNTNDQYLTNEVRNAIVVMTPSQDPISMIGDVPLEHYDHAGQRYERWSSNWRHGNPVQNLIASLKELSLETATVGVVGLSSRAVGAGNGIVPYATWTKIISALPHVTFVDVADAFETLSIFKSAEEQVMLRKAAALGEQACQAYADAARVGASESEVTAAAINAIVSGGGWIRSPFILERAGSSLFAWHQPEWMSMGGKPYVLAAGDTIASEIFAFFGGIESQQQIDVSIGEPDRLLRELEEVCIASYDAGIAALKPGMMFSELAAIMEEPLHRSKTWNTGPMVQTVSPIYNSATRINPQVDPALAHLPSLPLGVGLDGDFAIKEGVAFAFEPNALRDGKRVCIGGTVLLSANGVEELNTLPNRLIVVNN